MLTPHEWIATETIGELLAAQFGAPGLRLEFQPLGEEREPSVGVAGGSWALAGTVAMRSEPSEVARSFTDRPWSALVTDAADQPIGVHRTYMGGLERGERNLTLKSLERLAAMLEVDELELLR